MITIGTLSRRTGVNIETIRYYERIGLVPPPPRTESGRRSYGANEIRRLTFIRHARDLGFDIAAIRTLLALQEEPGAPCEEISQIARDQLESVVRRLGQLAGLRDELERMIGECANGQIANCRIIEALAEPAASDPRS